MAVCEYCSKDMLDPEVKTCTLEVYDDFSDGKPYQRERWIPEDTLPNVRCHDCNIAPGGFHHPGCDVELCLRCGGQAIACECEIEGI